LGSEQRQSRQVSEEALDYLQDLVEKIVKGIVDKEDEVAVDVEQRKHCVVVYLETSTDEVGLVIGNGGRVISGVRAMLDAFGGKHNTKVELDYVTEVDRKTHKARRA
jgi:predicted RNA-binding protein YlqC (UPF0109 family)